ncbi:MAG: GMC family oxidoreductase [Gemmatimonadota bacterium]
MLCDAVIVGSGLGGASAALVLAQAGWRVVMVERGRGAHRDAGDWDQRRIVIERRYGVDTPVLVRQYGARAYQADYPNAVVGGNSVFYGGAAMRLRLADLAAWPLTYGDLEPHYARAEQLLGVHGAAGADPLEPPRTADYPHPPIALTPPAQRIHAAAARLGHRPFAVPLALNFRDASRPLCVRCDTCDGFPCPIRAKNDAQETLLAAARQAGLEVVDGVLAARLRLQGDRAAALECRAVGEGRAFEIEADTFVLAAGALHSPVLLLRSGLEGRPGSESVGRHLMRHCNAVVVGVFPFRTNPGRVFHKQVCLTDFYDDRRSQDGAATGVIQDIYTPSAEVLRHFAPHGVRRLAGAAAACMQNLLCIAEDEPRPENAVTLSGERDRYGLEVPAVDHAYTRGDLARRDHLVGRARAILREAGALFTRRYEIGTFSHAVGTLRVSAAPEDGAVDPWGRFWGLENVYVTDGSVFARSGGVNPSLTIAAFALRAAEALAAA